MLRDKISHDLKLAIKLKDKIRTATLRLIIATIKDLDISNRNTGKPFADNHQIQEILNRMITQREETASKYQSNGFKHLANTEYIEINIIRDFLPRRLNHKETIHVIDSAITKNSAKELRDIGKVMEWLRKNYASQINCSQIASIVREKLTKN